MTSHLKSLDDNILSPSWRCRRWPRIKTTLGQCQCWRWDKVQNVIVIVEQQSWKSMILADHIFIIFTHLLSFSAAFTVLQKYINTFDLVLLARFYFSRISRGIKIREFKNLAKIIIIIVLLKRKKKDTTQNEKKRLKQMDMWHLNKLISSLLIKRVFCLGLRPSISRPGPQFQKQCTM